MHQTLENHRPPNHSHIYLSIVGQVWLNNIIIVDVLRFFLYWNHRGSSSRQVLHHWWDPLKSWPAACKNCILWYCSYWILNARIKRDISEFVVCCIYIGIVVGVPCPLKAIFETNSRFPALLYYCKNLCAKCYLPCCSDTGGGSLWNWLLLSWGPWMMGSSDSGCSVWFKSQLFRSSQTKSSQGCFW